MLNNKETEALTYLIREEIEQVNELIKLSPEDTEELSEHITILKSVATKLSLSL